MKNKLIKLFEKYREIIMYIIFGGLTTLINITCFVLINKVGVFHYQITNIIAWIISVLFAFVTNKYFVFNSKSKSNLLKESVKFYGSRLISLAFDIVLMYILIDLINSNDLIAKIITNIFVIIINYVISKKFIFKNKQ